MGKIEKDLKGIIESILLVAEKPVSTKELSSCSGFNISDINKELISLIEDYKNRGIRIIKKGEYYSLVTNPDNSDVVAKYLNEELRHDLSKAALETLSIITYKQPVTRIDIEEIRGVSSDHLIRNLLIRGLIQEVGRKDSPGRPILYGTTMEFLQFFGLNSEEEIPNFEEPNNKNLFKKVDTIEVRSEN